MTPLTNVTQLVAALRMQLDENAIVEITPSREAGRHNLWVVGAGAPTVAQALIDSASDGLHDSLNSVQVFETQEEADRVGIRLASARSVRSDWATRAGPDIYADQLSLDLDSLDPSFEAPLVVSFYSFRGGVGRSTALAHTAAALAARGRRVVLVDADLEAPGLHHAFGMVPETPQGSMPLLAMLARLQRRDESEPPLDVRDYLVDVPLFENLYLLCAGDASPEYLDALNELQIRSWTIEAGNPVRQAVELLANSPLDPDVILVDARTGFTDTNATFLLGASDHVVIVFYPSQQSRAGNELVTRTLRRTQGRRGRPLGVHFVASPLPAGPGEQTLSELALRGRSWAATWTSQGTGDVDDPDFIGVPYASAFALTDRIVTDHTLLGPYEAIADWIDPGQREVNHVPAPALERIRTELQFSAGNSDVPDEDIGRLFVRTDDAARVLDPRIMLVEGRKGTGKTTLFRWLWESQGAIRVIVPERLRKVEWWPTRDVWQALSEVDPDFRLTWPVVIALRAAEENLLSAPQVVMDLLSVVRSGGVSGLVAAVESVAATEQAPLAATEIMVDTLKLLAPGARLIFDGLDTSFGYAVDDQRLRDHAIGALLPLLLDREASLPNVHFTVFLRTDIVEGINFANQSHLFGRRLRLQWDKEDYLKTVLKQALASSAAFAELVGAKPAQVDDMTVDQTLSTWYALVGVRVRGKQTAFTDRWIWSRLADGNGDHSPRHLAQFFGVLAEKARLRVSDGGPPLRARDFGPALSDVVSAEALTAVKDEFAKEVELVLPIFERIDESPFEPSQWENAGGDTATLSLARTMGLVAVHTRERGRLVVPELYRYAVNVRRRGPA